MLRCQEIVAQMTQEYMNFSTEAILKAIAIVSVFETGRPFGDFSAVAVLNDGAGISYGISQFTHRSGSLAAVLNRYFANGGMVGKAILGARSTTLEDRTPAAIRELASDERFKSALRVAGITREMKAAQVSVAIRFYVAPAIAECRRRGFTEPLSLAVIYDSFVHGSFERISAIVKAPSSFERAWTTEYVRRRDRWLASIPRLAATRCRTRFFLNQIRFENWQLELPIRVHGVTLTNGMIMEFAEMMRVINTDLTISAVGPSLNEPRQTISEPSTNLPVTSPTEAQPPIQSEPPASAGGLSPAAHDIKPVESTSNNSSCLDTIESRVNAAAARYDQVERIATAVTTRNDAAKSLWTTVIGSLSQTFWALFGILAGIPREVWLAVAVIAALLTLMYLYRQITLGKIREKKVSGLSSQVSSR